MNTDYVLRVILMICGILVIIMSVCPLFMVAIFVYNILNGNFVIIYIPLIMSFSVFSFALIIFGVFIICTNK